MRTVPLSVPDSMKRLGALLPAFEKRAQSHDTTDQFVLENYTALKQARVMSLPIPKELGGQGCELSELADVLRRMGAVCGSTALAFSMHLQTVAALVWHWKTHGAPVASVLQRIAEEQLGIATSNGSDWLGSSGSAKRTRGGFKVDANKKIISGSPGSDLLATSGIYRDPIAGPTVLHFLAPLSAPEIVIDSSWRAMGMRGTGSNTVAIKGFFVPDGLIVARRPQGVWHDLYHAAIMLALPLIYSVYLGIAEAAHALAIESTRRRPHTSTLVDLAGTMEMDLCTARMAVNDMLAAATESPGPQTTSRIFIGRSLAANGAIAAVEKAFELIGAPGFMRGHPIERMFRDVQAARFHPGGPVPARAFAGLTALGLPIDKSQSEK